jgi:HNH endonuclease
MPFVPWDKMVGMKKIPTVSDKWCKVFWANATPTPTGCSEWKGAPDADGYAICSIGGWPYRASRVAYRLSMNQDPGDNLVCHTCDNRKCIAPAHLFLGSNNDNIQDMVKKGRQARGEKHGFALHPESVARGSRNWWSKLTESDVVEIRALYAKGGKTQRQIGAMFGINNQNVSMIVNRISWRHI